MSHPLFLVLMALCVLVSPPAQAGQTDDKVFGIGGGAAFQAPATGNPPLEAYIRVESDFCAKIGNGFCLVLARGTAQGTVGAQGLGSLDIDYDVIGGEFDISGGDGTLVAGTALLGLTTERNVAIDRDHVIRLSILGIRARGEVAINDDAVLFARAAVNLLELSYAKTIASSPEINGFSQSFSAELGAKLFKRLRISVKERFGRMTGGDSVRSDTDQQTCSDVLDSHNSVSRVCTPVQQTTPRYELWSSVTSLLVKLELGYHVSLFAQGSYLHAFTADQLGGLADNKVPTPGPSGAVPVQTGHPSEVSRDLVQVMGGVEVDF